MKTQPKAAGRKVVGALRGLFAAGLGAMILLAGQDAAQAQTAYDLAWVRQLGTLSQDYSSGVSADGLGNVYISGYTFGSLGGPNAGGTDAFLAKYSPAGSLLWTRQLGTGSDDLGLGVSADGLGNVYISGYTSFGSLGGPNAGGADAFLAKYSAAGSLLWTRQLGTGSDDLGLGVSADGLGNVYISGWTWGSLGGPSTGERNAFLAKYSAAGSLLWTRQLGTTLGSTFVTNYVSVSADGLGNAYISGTTLGSLSGPNAGHEDAFLAKYDATGSLLWTRQLGTTSYDYSSGVSADGLGNAYISGTTHGSLSGPNAGNYDAFLAKYDAAGGLLWTRQLGTSDWDQTSGVSADALGNVYIGGYTRGSLGGANAGGNDAFLAKYDAAGGLLWTRQLGTLPHDYSSSVSADGLGNVYISGWTGGSLGGPNAGGDDAFLAKFAPHTPCTYGVFIGSNDYKLSGEIKVNGIADAYAIKAKFDALMGLTDTRMLNYAVLDILSNPWSDITGVLNEYTKVVKPGDNLIFFYSGHGSGSETDPSVDESLAPTLLARIVDDDLAGWFLDASRRDKWADVNKLFILDSCYSGGFWNGEDADLSALDRMALLAASSEMGLAASNPDADCQGYFSLALAEGLEKVGRWARADTGKDGLSVQDLLDWLNSYPGYPSEITGYLKDGWSDDLVTLQWGVTGTVSPDFDMVVPEPASLLLLALGGLVLLRCRRSVSS